MSMVAESDTSASSKVHGKKHEAVTYVSAPQHGMKAELQFVRSFRECVRLFVD